MGKRVLVIERDDVLADALCMLLTEEGFEAVKVENAHVESMAALQPDLILLAEVLESTDGYLEIMMNETTPFRRKLTHCFGAN